VTPIRSRAGRFRKGRLVPFWGRSCARGDAVHRPRHTHSRYVSAFRTHRLRPVSAPTAPPGSPRSTRWLALSRDQAVRLDELANSELRRLTADELNDLDWLVGWALYCDDDGNYIGADEDTDEDIERPDLTDEQRQWLRGVIRAIWNERLRRRLPEGLQEVVDRRVDMLALRRPPAVTPHSARGVVRARPREGRARSRRSRARSPGRSTDDDPEPARRALAWLEFVPAGAAA
jgi:hypothetical protein